MSLPETYLKKTAHTSRASINIRSVQYKEVELPINKTINALNPYFESLMKTLDVKSEITLEQIEINDIKEKLNYTSLNKIVIDFFDRNEARLYVSNDPYICKILYKEFEKELFDTYQVFDNNIAFVKTIPEIFNNKCKNVKSKIVRDKDKMINMINNPEKYLLEYDISPPSTFKSILSIFKK